VTPATSVLIDGQPVTIDAQGRGMHTVDVSPELTGSSAKTDVLQRKLKYAVTPHQGETARGEVDVQLGITPLVVESPGPSSVIDQANFMLAGRTMKGGSVSVAGRAITVDSEGGFAQLMNVSSQGRTTVVVRASAAERAPRLVPIDVSRVASLADEAARERKRALVGYDALEKASSGKQGVTVVVDGKVMEARAESYSSIMLIDVARGCTRSPCVVRVISGSKLDLDSGDAVTVVGETVGLVDGPRRDQKIPELRAKFVLQGRR
jgi:hypothetical protein